MTIHILWVDDELYQSGALQTYQKTYPILLSRRGITDVVVHIAGSVMGGIQAFQKQPPDVMILDNHLVHSENGWCYAYGEISIRPEHVRNGLAVLQEVLPPDQIRSGRITQPVLIVRSGNHEYAAQQYNQAGYTIFAAMNSLGKISEVVDCLERACRKVLKNDELSPHAPCAATWLAQPATAPNAGVN